MLTDQEKAKIRHEAEALYPVLMQSMVDEPLWDMNKQYRDVWIAAVTAERERAKVLVDAANKIKTWIVAHPKKATIYRPVIEEFFNAINKYEQ